MKVRIGLVLMALFFGFAACENQEDMEGGELAAHPLMAYKEYTGLDMEGVERTCHDDFKNICTLEFTDSDQFALDCQREGNYAVACGCHDWICVNLEDIKPEPVKKEEVGLNSEGEVESCVPFDFKEGGEEIACTTVFTEEEEFAIDCQEAGHRAVQCGCHKYICVE